MFGFDLIPLIKSVGYLGILLCVLLENGVIFFFFLPSDSLLFAAGFLASQSVLDIRFVVPICIIGAILGYMMGYFLGQKAAPSLKAGKISKYIDQEHLEQAEQMYKKYANWALLLARFFPVRAFVSFLAGATNVPYNIFMFYNVLGGVLWAVSLTLLGYFLGELFTPEDLDAMLICVLALFVVCVGGMFIILHFYRAHIRKKKARTSAE